MEGKHTRAASYPFTLMHTVPGARPTRIPGEEGWAGKVSENKALFLFSERAKSMAMQPKTDMLRKGFRPLLDRVGVSMLKA